MSVRKFLALAPMAAAAVLTLAAPMSANALSVVYDNLTATGTYSLNGGPVVNVLPWLDTASAKDVLDFSGDGTNSYGMHSYGDTSGNFGTRSSGTGIYDVTGSFTITMTLTNNEGAARSVGFDYYITPGQLSLQSFAYGAGQFAQTSASFDISVNGASMWNSAATLRADESNQTGAWTQTGENIYAGSGQNYNVVGGQHHLDLGVLDAGQSLSLTYTLKSAASGNAVSGTTTTIPGWVEVIPAHWVEYNTCDYGGEFPATLQALAATASDEEGPIDPPPGECTTVREFVPEEIITHEETVINEGGTGGSHSSTGDPFLFNLSPFFGPQLTSDPTGAGFGFTSVSTGNDVPEPGALSLVALALAGAGVARRRRRG